MKFDIQIKYSGRWYKLKVEQFNVTERLEKFKIIGRNKTIVLESNRPLFRNKGLKHRKPDWKLVEGSLTSTSGLEEIQQKILEIVDTVS